MLLLQEYINDAQQFIYESSIKEVADSLKADGFDDQYQEEYYAG